MAAAIVSVEMSLVFNFHFILKASMPAGPESAVPSVIPWLQRQEAGRLLF